MPVFSRPDAEIYYEVHGSGFPLLIFAPGGLVRSQIEHWRQSVADPKVAPVHMNPMVDLASTFTVVAMDQRNCGRSRGRVYGTDGWHTYTSDHLALMDHLGHKRFHVMGGCIGGSFCMAAVRAAPERVAAAVLQNPIGLHENRDTWEDSVRGYGKVVMERDPSVTPDAIASLGRNLYDSGFVFSVTREFVRECKTPLYVQPGDDKPHPTAIGEEIAKLAPNVERQMPWKNLKEESIRRVGDFLVRNTPR
jgi:pimeloyl-ACP methyl ester carboxylesterase